MANKDDQGNIAMGDIISGPSINAPSPKFTIQSANTAFKKAEAAARNLSPTGLDAGGLSARFKNDQIKTGSSKKRRGLVDSLSNRFRDQAREIRGLRRRVAPGISELRAARLQEIENARRSSVSNLRDNLARRRVLGSSFGEDAVTRTELEFAQAKEQVAAESFLQELDLTNQFVQQEFDLRRQSVATRLNELNIKADLAANLTSQANSTLAASAQLQAQLAIGNADFRSNLFNAQSDTAATQAGLDADAASGAGSLIGTLLTAPVTGGGSLFANALT